MSVSPPSISIDSPLAVRMKIESPCPTSMKWTLSVPAAPVDGAIVVTGDFVEVKEGCAVLVWLGADGLVVGDFVVPVAGSCVMD